MNKRSSSKTLSHTLFLISLLHASTFALAETPSLSGYWQGSVQNKGDTWPVVLRIENDSKPIVKMSLPELWMFNEPIKAMTIEHDIQLEMPFGLGRIMLSHCGSNLCGTTEPETTLTMQLAKTEPSKISKTIPFQFKSDKALIRGTLQLPNGNGPFPLIILAHGSAGNTRESWSYTGKAPFFLNAGFAVLTYDKRGFGESNGTWMQTSYPNLDELGLDLSHAIEWASKHPEIEANHIGVMGGSQAAWVVALASQQTNLLSFVILTGAPAVTPIQQEKQRIYDMFSFFDWPDSVRQNAFNHTDLYFKAVEDAQFEQAVFQSTGEIESQDWSSDVPLAKTSDDFYWWRQNGNYSPQQAIHHWKFPVLLLYGQNDSIVPAQHNLPVWNQLLSNTHYESELFAGGDHRIELRGGKQVDGSWKFPRMAKELETRIIRFLCKNVHSANSNCAKN